MVLRRAPERKPSIRLAIGGAALVLHSANPHEFTRTFLAIEGAALVLRRVPERTPT